MRCLRAVICIGCAALVAGCDLLPVKEPLEPAPWVQPGGRQPATDVESLVLYFNHIRKLSANDLNREYDAARQAYNRGRYDFNRVRFAMLLSLPNAPFYDDGRALDVLEPVLQNGDGRLQGLAQILGSQIQEQKRLNASVQGLQQNVQGLQQKLDALKSLERSIIERSR